MPADFQSTARALSLPLDDPDDFDSPASSPVWRNRGRSGFAPDAPTSALGGFVATTTGYAAYAADRFRRLPILYQALAVLGTATLLTLGVLFIVYSEKIWQALLPVANSWRELPAGWLLLWSLTFIVSFPPMIGYSSCVTGAGFIFGVGKGWLIAASGTVIGSTAAFLVCQTLLRDFAARLAARDRRFAALSATLHHDGLKLLCMIRLCPLPYSFSNGAIASFPAVRWPGFMFATAVAAPKLFIHVFIGSRLAIIAEGGGHMDWKVKALNYAGIALGIAIGVVTGVVIYRRTSARARELDARDGRFPADAPADAPGQDAARAGFSGQRSGITLREQGADGAGEGGDDDDDEYRDEWNDDDALSDPFAGADSDLDADLERGKKAGEGR